MKTIVIVGLLPSQQRIVSRFLPDCDCRYIDTNQSALSIPHCDHLFLMVRFIRHKWTRHAWAKLGRDNVTLHFGGVKNLIGKIRGWVDNVPSKVNQ